eukprot:GFYU01000750.1.p1 GENE.GFYU01000750.1~~GFYU01000750.1.p1  ORF type:complete len:384 (+),score=99.85 GFYU01000750.1:40-1152(+)
MGKAKLHSFTVQGTNFLVDDRYEPIKAVGSGAYGIVCSAKDKENPNEKVAIKKITRAFIDVIDAKRTLREIKLLKHFEHENIIAIKNLGRPPSRDKFEDVYVTCELMETDLHKIIRSPQPLSDEHIQYFVYQLLRGLKYVHSGNVLHRDIKPSNLLLNSNCDLKICDFGLARPFDGNSEFNMMTEYVVTRWYRAPELVLSCGDYSDKIDVWSAGCILAELLGRKPLFPGKDYVHQLKLIMDIVGTPNEDEMHFINNPEALKFVRGLSYRPKVPFSQIYPKANPQALDLLDKILAFDPAKRYDVNQALEHPYLAALHDPEFEPTCNNRFKFDWETPDMTGDTLKELIYQEIVDFHKGNMDMEVVGDKGGKK